MTKTTKLDVAAEAQERTAIKERARTAANEVLKVLVNAILDRQLVPLLGAGVSTQARSSNEEDLPTGAQNVPELVKILGKTLYPLAVRPRVGSVASRKRLIVDAYERKSLAELCELFVDEYESARGVRSDEAHEKLCDVLRIADFVGLCPTPAHRLIAFLACEGLVPEVVTTNYDCCLERAFAETHGQDPERVARRGREMPESSSERANSDFDWGPDVDVWVSHDLQTYRRSAKRLPTDAPSRDQPFLRIHKINGCALALRRKRGAYAKRILLTERQLQSWRDRQWAADMIRDRLRTRKILTCGFGSEEPQVRHTVALITEEEPTNDTERGGTTLLKRPNLIVVAGYGSQPTFAQHQVLTAQWIASSPSGADSAAKESTTKYGPYQAFLGPKSRAGFHYASKTGATLPADDLWLELYGRVATRLLQGELALRGEFARIVRSIVPCGGVLVERLNQRLFVAPDAQEQRRRLFGWAKPAETSTLASEIIEAVDSLEPPENRQVTRYRPLREDSFTLLWVMTIRLALGASPVPEDDDLATVKAPLRDWSTGATGGGDSKVADVQVRLSMHGPQTPSRLGDDVVLAISNPSSKPPPVYSAYSTPVVRERSDGGRGTLRRAAPVVDLQTVLRAEGRSAGNTARFDELLQRVVLFPTEPQRWGQRGVRSLNRRL